MVAELALRQPDAMPRASARRRRRAAERALVRLADADNTPGAGRGRRRGIGRIFRLATGWVIFVIGVIFVILPIIPGTPLVILAAVLLAPDVPMFARVLDWSKTRFSGMTSRVNAYNERFNRDFHRRFQD